MAKSATATAKPTAKKSARQPKVREVELGTQGATVLDQLANARQDRLTAERVEKPLKGQLKEMYAAKVDKLKAGDTLVVKAMGVVRGRVTLRGQGKKVVDMDLLLTAFPEAYEACVTDAPLYSQFDPA